MALIEAEAAKVGSKALIWAIGVAATMAVGFGAAEVYEHRAPWGLEHQRDAIRDSIPAQLTKATKVGADAQFDKDTATLKTYQDALGDYKSRLDAASQSGADQLAAMRRNQTSGEAAAFKLGQSACFRGVPTSATPTTGSPAAGGPPAGSLPDGDADLRDILAGAAFRPAP